MISSGNFHLIRNCLFLQSLVYTQEDFPWTGNFSLSCELPCATNGLKTKEIFLSEENFPVCKRALIAYVITI